MNMTPMGELWFSVFHSISAFCNAGFSTVIGGLTNSSLINNNAIYIIISFLIIIGGIGFPVFSNFFYMIAYKIKRLIKKISSPHKESYPIKHIYNINSKIVLIFTLILLVGGFGAILWLEWNGVLKDMSMPEKLTQAFFNSVSPRTAGFNSVNMTDFCTGSIIIIMILMWIGGGAQSTAGGVKVTTFAVSLLNVVSVSRNKSRVEIFSREISPDSIRRASATILLSIIIITISFFCLTLFEPDISPKNLLFECVSAFGTVGLSLNTTMLLGDDSKLVIIILMFVGRVGLITLLLGIIKQSNKQQYTYPQENIIIN